MIICANAALQDFQKPMWEEAEGSEAGEESLSTSTDLNVESPSGNVDKPTCMVNKYCKCTMTLGRKPQR